MTNNVPTPASGEGHSTGLALVTGATGGIGCSIVNTLQEAGFDVVAADISVPTDQAILAKHQGGRVLRHHVDVANEASVAALFAACYETFGRYPTHLVNNAGVQTWKPLIELELHEWERTIATNLTGCFLLTRCFARHLIADNQPGAIVNIGSGCNKLAFPSLVDYAASKGGVEMFTKSSALELGPHRIRVNCIAPGAIETQRTQQESADFAGSWAALTPLRRVGQPSDVSASVLMLLSESSSFITGQTINVDGGVFSCAVWPEKDA